MPEALRLSVDPNRSVNRTFDEHLLGLDGCARAGEEEAVILDQVVAPVNSGSSWPASSTKARVGKRLGQPPALLVIHDRIPFGESVPAAPDVDEKPPRGRAMSLPRRMKAAAAAGEADERSSRPRHSIRAGRPPARREEARARPSPSVRRGTSSEIAVRTPPWSAGPRQVLVVTSLTSPGHEDQRLRPLGMTGREQNRRGAPSLTPNSTARFRADRIQHRRTSSSAPPASRRWSGLTKPMPRLSKRISHPTNTDPLDERKRLFPVDLEVGQPSPRRARGRRGRCRALVYAISTSPERA